MSSNEKLVYGKVVDGKLVEKLVYGKVVDGKLVGTDVDERDLQFDTPYVIPGIAALDEYIKTKSRITGSRITGNERSANGKKVNFIEDRLLSLLAVLALKDEK